MTEKLPALIGIGGLLQHGKDTVADYLVEKHGWVKMGMSDPLNEALLILNPWVKIDNYISHPIMRVVQFDPGFYPYQEIYATLGYVRAKKIPDVRAYLQRLGTEVGRNLLGENIWVNAAEMKIEKLTAEGKNVILTGVRYPNELALIHRQGGELWWVERPSLVNADSSASHSSENSVTREDFDLVVYNDGTLAELYETVDRKIYT